MPVHVSFSQFCDLVRRAMESFPESFQPYLENVVVDVFKEPSAEDYAVVDERDEDARPVALEPGAEVDDEESDESASDLLGLFVGVPLTEQSYGDHPPNQVKIFQGPLERASRSGRALLQNIRATVLHEMAHHFGFSEEDLDEFEATQEHWLD